jgi:hypothetical protein
VRKSRFNEEQIIAILKDGGGWDSPRRAVPAARDHTREPVPVEGEVRGDGTERGAATAAAGGGKPAAEARRGRADGRKDLRQQMPVVIETGPTQAGIGFLQNEPL